MAFEPVFLTTAAEKLLKQLAALVAAHARDDLYPVIQYVGIGYAEVRFDGAEPQIVRPEDKPGDAGIDERSGTHRARFERRIYGDAREPIIIDRPCRQAQSLYLGMRRRVVKAYRFVARGREQLARSRYDARADRHLARGSGETRLRKRFVHPILVRFRHDSILTAAAALAKPTLHIARRTARFGKFLASLVYKC